MSMYVVRDGEIADFDFLRSTGFLDSLNSKRDLRFRQFSDEAVYSFVGFVINDSGDSLIVLPKHFAWTNIMTDSTVLFRAITRHPQLHPDKYVGDRKKHFASNYPFASFFVVYDYYKKYGLYRETEQSVSLNSSGRIDWKRTIQQSTKIPVDDTVVFSPLRYRATKNVETLITECMSFVIGYTLSRFGFLFEGESFSHYPNRNLLENKDYVIGKLLEERNRSFLDTKIDLIDALISFFSGTNIGGPYYLKHYSFEKIWESAALSYLRSRFQGVCNGQLCLSDSPTGPSDFNKAYYALNIASPGQTMEPDYYLLDDGLQCIFDAKYYSSVDDVDYKQLVYTMLLSHLINPKTGEEYCLDTCSALILPSETRSSRLHFKIDSSQVNLQNGLEIYEERLPASEVLYYYVSMM